MAAAVLTLYDALLKHASAHPEREALVCAGERRSYGELVRRIDLMASNLGAVGVRPGLRVALVLPPGILGVTAFFAVLRAGAIVVPLNPQLRRAQLARLLGEVEPALVIACGRPDAAEDTDTLRSILRAAPVAPRLVVAAGPEAGAAPGDIPLAELLTESASSLGTSPSAATDLAVILYTSGTTGMPKGVMHSQRGLMAPVIASLQLRRMWLHKPSPKQLLRMSGLVVRYGKRLLQAAGQPQTMLTAIGPHAIAGVETMLQALLMGDRLILMPRFHPAETLRCIERERVTILIAVPLALSVLVRMRELHNYDLSSLLICGTGAAPCPPELARQVQQRFGCAVHIGFGTTEIGGGIAATSLEDAPDIQAETVGHGMPGMELRVVDETRRPLPAGQRGELACRSASRMLGYYHAPELTHQVLDDEGWYYTGDLAVMDERGLIRIVGRSKDVIIRGGQNIDPAEIEQHLMTHPAIREAAVVGVASAPREPGGLGSERVWAFVLLEDGAHATAAEVLDHCRATLEAHKIPDEVRLVTSLPRSSLGKVQKKELRERASQEDGAGRS